MDYLKNIMKGTKESILNVKDLYKVTPVSRKQSFQYRNPPKLSRIDSYISKKVKNASISTKQNLASLILVSKTPTNGKYFFGSDDMNPFSKINNSNDNIKNSNHENLDCIDGNSSIECLILPKNQRKIHLPVLPKINIKIKPKTTAKKFLLAHRILELIL